MLTMMLTTMLVAVLLGGWVAPFEDHSVDIDGHTLRARVLGDEGPVVVLESGLGDSLAVWERVQEPVSKFCRVVAYDRAGLGESEPGPEPRSPQQIALELRALLDALGLEGPYILVSHSAGGLHTRTFAALFPGDVAGMIDVDASHERQEVLVQERFGERRAEEQERLVEFYARRAPGVQAEWAAIQAVIDEASLPGVDGRPDVPTIILTATKTVADADWIGETEEGMLLRVELHAAGIASLSNAVHLKTDVAGHYMHVERPDIVVTAIHELCRAVADDDKLSVEPLKAAAVSLDALRRR